MVIQLDPQTDVLSLTKQLDKLIAEGRAATGGCETYTRKVQAFFQTLGRVMAAVERQAIRSVADARRHAACRAALLEVGAGGWDLLAAAELVEMMVRLRREGVPLLVEALIPSARIEEPVFGYVRVVVRSDLFEAWSLARAGR